MKDINRLIDEVLDDVDVVSTHEHHMFDEQHSGLTLDTLIANSYIGLWYGEVGGTTYEARAQWLDKVQYNSYFVWLQKSLARLYGVDRLTADNWDATSELIAQAHRDPGHHLRILTDHGRYRRWVQDAFWENGNDLGHSELVSPIFRIDPWMKAFDVRYREDDREPLLRTATAQGLRSLDELEQLIAATLDAGTGKYVGFKCAMAYDRDLSFEDVDADLARATFGKPAGVVSEAEALNFGNHMMSVFLDHSANRGLPLQIHTGLARISGSNPMRLAPLIEAHPEVTFALFHGGFPWVYETAGLAHQYQNVFLDINWLPIISTSAAQTALAVYLDVLPDSRRICWGGDSWTSEESYGALLALKHVLRGYGRSQIEQGLLHFDQIERLIHKICHENAQALFFSS